MCIRPPGLSVSLAATAIGHTRWVRESGELEIVGIQFNEVPGLSRTWLPLTPGMTVLYGLNGAGKTTIVEEMKRLLSPKFADWSPHRVLLRHHGIARACSEFDVEADEQWWDAVVRQIELIPGLHGQVRPEPYAPIPRTPALYECLCSGYLCLSRTAPGIASYALSAVAPIDGSTRFIQRVFDRLKDDAEEEMSARQEYAEAIRRWDAGETRVVLGGVEQDVTPDFIAVLRRYLEAAADRPQGPEVTVGDVMPHLLAVDHPGFDYQDPEIDELWMKSVAPGLPVDRKDEGPDGNPQGVQYLRLIDIAELWASPLTVTSGANSDPVETTARYFLRKHLEESGEQRAFELWAKETQRIPPGAVEMDDTRRVVTIQDAWLDALTSHARAQYGDLLLDAPRLALVPSSGIKGLTGPPFEWRAKLADEETTIGIDDLSSAQATWARFAIGRASRAGSHSAADLVLLDEPERGLHRTAESYLASGLAQVASSPGAYVIAATHSPDLLDQTGTHLVEVIREGTRARLRAMRPPDQARMRDLGLHPSDLLKRVKTFVLVEGPHDRAVFEATIGQELRAARAQILYLGGATQLKAAIEGQFLCDFTDARIVAVLDNLPPKIVGDAWRDAESVMLSEGFPAALALLEQRLRADKRKGREDEGTEINAIRELMIRALETGQESRIVPIGMSKPDIIMYLPVEELVPGSESWEQLWDEFVKQKGNTNAPKSFKTWLRVKRHVLITTEGVDAAAQHLDVVHPDISALLVAAS